MDILDPVENVYRRPQPGVGAAGQVDLRDIAGDNHFRAEPEPGQEHLHLLAGGVLCLVENDERVIQCVMRQQKSSVT